MPPSCLFSGLPVLGAVAVCLLASARPAHAAGLPLLVVHRTVDATDCPDARALAALVATQMKRPALEPAAVVAPDRGIDVQIYRSEQGFTAVIRAGGKTRQLSDKGAACSSLAVALSISIAILLDTEPLPPEPEPPLPVAAPTPPIPAEPPAPSSPPQPLLAAPLFEGPPAEDRVPEPHRSRITLVAAPVLTVGILHAWAAGITSEVEIRFGRFSVAAGVLVLPQQTFTFAPGQISLDLTAGLVRACAYVTPENDPIRFAACIEPFAGSLSGSSRGFAVDRPTSLPWAAAGTSAVFQQRIWGPLAWGARAGLVIPLLKASLVGDNGSTAFTAAPAGGAWDAELRVSIW